jgi:hypothetical protein
VGRADWLLVGGFEAAAVIEGIARPDLAGQPYVTLLAMALMPALLWRRSHPLTTCLIGFGVAGLLSVIQLVTGTEDLGPSSMMVVLILLYSLVRWGSGREILVGMPYVVAVVALGMYAAAATAPDLIGGSLLLLLIVALSQRCSAHALTSGSANAARSATQERLALARELHDTVAHHVSAIAVQAQAGGVIVRTQPAQAAQMLTAIEAEATRTLAEMRAMVRVLREDDWEDGREDGPRGRARGWPRGTSGRHTPRCRGSPISPRWRALTRPRPSTSRSPAPSPRCPDPWMLRSTGSRRKRSPMPYAMRPARPASRSTSPARATASGCA